MPKIFTAWTQAKRPEASSPFLWVDTRPFSHLEVDPLAPKGFAWECFRHISVSASPIEQQAELESARAAYLKQLRKSFAEKEDHWTRFRDARQDIVISCLCVSPDFCHRQTLARTIAKAFSHLEFDGELSFPQETITQQVVGVEPTIQEKPKEPLSIDRSRFPPVQKILVDFRLKANSFVALDFETVDSKEDGACSLGLIRVENGYIVDRWYGLFCPPRPPKPMAYAVHKLSMHELKKHPPVAERWKEFAPLLKGVDCFVAHNAHFDEKILRGCAKLSGEAPLPVPMLCTLQLAKALWPNLTGYRLSDLATRFGIKLEHHHAGSDAEACARIFFGMQSMLALTALRNYDTHPFDGHET
jgi:DNA polymerase-3 subunit epsilon